MSCRTSIEHNTTVQSKLLIIFVFRFEYFEQIYNLKKYLSILKVPNMIQNQVKYFLTQQWYYYSGNVENQSFDYLSSRIIYQAKTQRYFDILKQQVIFSPLPKRAINELAVKCKPIFCPTNNNFLTRGAVVEHMYIIEEGTLEESMSYKDWVRYICSGVNFCLIEMFLEKRSHLTYKAVTDAIIISISKKDIDDVFYKWNKPLSHHLKTTVNKFAQSTEVFRIFNETFKEKEEKVAKTKFKSWKTFSKHKKNKSCIDYNRSLKKSYQLRICKYFMMRRTILPDGQFIKKYEICFSVILIFSIIAHSSMLLIMDLSHYSLFLYIFFFIFGLVDMFLRFHMAYYNEQGILVTHPWCTAKNYITTSFLIELIALAPVDIILHSRSTILDEDRSLSTDHYLKFIFSFNKLLYLYRYKGIYYLSSGSIHLLDAYRIAMWVIPLLVVFLNVLTMTYFYVNLDLKLNYNEIERSSWYFDYDILELGNMYIDGFFWVTMTTLGCLPLRADTYPWILPEIIMMFICLLFGHIVLMKVLILIVKIYNCKHSALWNNLVHSQELIKYMKKAKLKSILVK